MEEIWKDIKGYEGRFKISNHGRVLSINGRYKGNKILCPPIGKEGYYIVRLRNKKTKKDIRIHNLVANAFIANPENKPCVNHIDGNKLNNNINNLEWVTYKENSEHAIHTGLLNTKGENHCHALLTEKEVLEIRDIYSKGNISHEKLGIQFRISRRHIGDIINKICWKHI